LDYGYRGNDLQTLAVTAAQEVFGMMKKRILAIGLTAVFTIGASVSVWANGAAMDSCTAETYPAEILSICRIEPTMLTDYELSELIIISPDVADTRSNLIMPGRRITSAELTAWSYEYWELGGVNAFELEVVRLINIERTAVGLHPLSINPQLSMAARFHSQEMADLRFFNHRSPHHGRGIYRAEMFGHENIQEHVWGVRENIASGTRSPESVVQAWMNSPGHRAAILEVEYLTIGVGAVQGGGTTAKFGA